MTPEDLSGLCLSVALVELVAIVVLVRKSRRATRALDEAGAALRDAHQRLDDDATWRAAMLAFQFLGSDSAPHSRCVACSGHHARTRS